MVENALIVFLVGLLVGIGLSARIMNNHVDYWRGAYCIDTTSDLAFCDKYSM